MSLQEQMLELWNALWKLFVLLGQLLVLLLHPVILVPILLIITPIIVHIVENWFYKRTTYYNATKIPLRELKQDQGKYGEYLIYRKLKKLEASGARFLFNAYIPKENGKTTEIDVLMICSKGVFVFESKNYSGWIFGDENQKQWYQTLPMGRGRSRKESFYNPIMQNRKHITHLKALLGDHIPMWPMVVFSDKCTLKNGQIAKKDVYVRYLSNLPADVLLTCENASDISLSVSDVVELYEKLYPFTQVDADAKKRHIESIYQNQTDIITSSVSLVESNLINAMDQTQTLETPQLTEAVSEEKTEINETNVELPEIRAEIKVEQKPQIPLCPRCQSTLVLRTATRGANVGKQFYGCANYPRCKYIQNL